MKKTEDKTQIGGLDLAIINIAKLEVSLIEVENFRAIDYKVLREFTELLSSDDKAEVIKLCNFKPGRNDWDKVMRNLNPKYNQNSDLVWVVVTESIKNTIRNIQVKLGIVEEVVTLEDAVKTLG